MTGEATCGECKFTVPDPDSPDRVICTRIGCVYKEYTTDKHAKACDKFNPRKAKK